MEHSKPNINPPKWADWDRALEVVRSWKAQGQRIVLTNGCYDLLHYGHIYLLTRAKTLGDKLILAVNTPESIRKLKGPGRPILDRQSRLYILSALEPVDLLVEFNQDTPLELIRLLQPDVLVKGGDYQPETIVGAEVLATYDGEVVVIPFQEGFSTTGIAQKMMD
ncbi:MAG TPA: D-glycero-beta-D-manno-heptose 1-phosphate adenylyltransferase [Saprospiraceae bacterium]|nr:D-glycero-beta-D-manno-heptose 1-phosphate adenylyltransferase [Saprospiraceae bacterium]HRV85003.1 D-glycero-beta-D-manno-heptose 1-phosphate adenylyltransferase [Saprospiraceae bacterium]